MRSAQQCSERRPQGLSVLSNLRGGPLLAAGIMVRVCVRARLAGAGAQAELESDGSEKGLAFFVGWPGCWLGRVWSVWQAVFERARVAVGC